MLQYLVTLPKANFLLAVETENPGASISGQFDANGLVMVSILAL